MANAIVMRSRRDARLFGVEFPDVKIHYKRIIVSFSSSPSRLSASACKESAENNCRRKSAAVRHLHFSSNKEIPRLLCRRYESDGRNALLARLSSPPKTMRRKRNFPLPKSRKPIHLFVIEFFRRAITDDFLSAGVFEKTIGFSQIFAEFVRRQMAQRAMIKSARSDFVTAM